MYIVYQPIDQIIAKVQSIYQINSPSQIENVIEVDYVPEPMKYPGKIPTLYVNMNTKEFFYQYDDEPKPQDITPDIYTELTRLREETSALKTAMDELILGGGL